MLFILDSRIAFNKSTLDKTIVRLFKSDSTFSTSSFGEIKRLKAISTNCSSASIELNVIGLSKMLNTANVGVELCITA